MRNKLVLFYACLLVISVFGGLYFVWAYEYYEQVEYEANHTRLPIQNNLTINGSMMFNASALESFKLNASRTYFIKTYDESNSVILIRANNGSDYNNSTVEINMSYIKQVRKDNNTMIISIRRE